MDNSSADASAVPRQSQLPRPSRLPVRAGGLRSSPSIDALRSPGSSLRLPKLRATPSKDQLGPSARTSSIPRDRNVSSSSVVHTPLKKASRSSLYGGIYGNESSVATTPRDARSSSPHAQNHVGADDSNGAAEPSESRSSRKPRPSLSERTVETLSQLPPSPALQKRNSSFYGTGSPMRPPSRGNGSRPGTSGTDTSMGPPRSTDIRPPSRSGSGSKVVDTVPLSSLLSSTTTFKPSATFESSSTPTKSLRTPLRMKSYQNLSKTSTPKVATTPGPESSFQERSPSPTKKIPAVRSGSKTIGPRTLKPRASIGGLNRKPSWQGFDGAAEHKKVSPSLSDTSENSATSIPSKASSISSVAISESGLTPRKSSAALREQIAKAKAAKKAQANRLSSNNFSSVPSEETTIMANGEFDFGLSQDPFNQLSGIDENQGLLRKRVSSARTDGRLNIAGMGLKEIPAEVMNMYNLESVGSGSWAESVDLTRFVAADNELEFLGDDIFPDMDPELMQEDEDSKGNQFGGLETLDLHGNLLRDVPPGLRRLEMLTTLNISNNKLDNDCFSIVSQIKGLRDLKLAGNNLSGELPADISKLSNLEIIDVQNNALTTLPDGFAELIKLRILNLSGNQFTSLPFETLRQLPLIDLSATRNSLTGILMDLDDIEMLQLQTLDITANQLTAIAKGRIHLPALYQFSCTANRISALPEITTWVSLLTLSANDNSISTLPEGLVSLPKIRNVDFSGNNLVTLDDRIALMDSLDILRISGNPLREKKFSGMTTEDLKRALKARIVPAPSIEDLPVAQEASVDSDNSFATAPSPAPTSPMTAQFEWLVKAGGVLDHSNTKSYSLNPVAMSQIATNNIVKAVELHHNAFKEIPSSIAFFASTLTSLSLAHNELTSDTFLKDDLELPALKELNLSSNTFNTLTPLLQHLHAPALEKLDTSFNRLTTLPTSPPIKAVFPSLTVLLASNNTIRELSPDSIRGLEVVDCSSNELNSLNAKIGLLDGLKKLDVSGNRFRVPKYTVLDKGTEYLLSWLRDRIPAGEREVEEL